jgi:transcriptional regulator GlxA family with amidase domain
MAAVARRQELGFRLLGIILKHARQKAGAAALLSGQARIQPALDYMLAHLDEGVSRTRLAQSVHLSESRFHDVFQQATGKTAFEYLRQLRIQRAQELLLSSDASVADIGQRCGFPDQFHFSRQFKIVCGQSPRQYRSLAAKARLP